METTFEEWEKRYKPIENPFGCGFLFETYGEELEFVINCAKSNPDTVWTSCFCEGESYIEGGMRLVNRDGYYVTKIPRDINETIILKG